jgi:hypothetical protein
MNFAIIKLEQKKHTRISSNTTDLGRPHNACGYTAPYYRIPLKPGYTVAIGRSPLTKDADEGIYIPSDYVSRHVGFIRCTNSVNDELLHVLSVESQKIIITKDDEPISKNYILKDGDILKIETLPITIQYNIEVVSECINQFLEQEYYKTTFS